MRGAGRHARIDSDRCAEWRGGWAYLRVGPGVLSFPAESSLRARATGPRLPPLVSPSAARRSAKSRKPRQTWLFPRRRLRHDTRRQYAVLIGGMEVRSTQVVGESQGGL